MMETTNRSQEQSSYLRRLSSDLLNFITKVAPWLAPIPSAALVYRASQQHFHFSPVISVILALVIETVGLTSISNALSLWEFNQSKRKIDKLAPFVIALLMIAFYLISTIGLTYFLEVYPNLSKFGVIFLPFLGIMGVINIALRSDLERRLLIISQEKTERKEKRIASCQTTSKLNLLENGEKGQRNLSNNTSIYDEIDRLQAGRRAKFDTRIQQTLDIYSDYPGMKISDAARRIGVSRQTMHSYVNQLTDQGKLKKNGHGIETVAN